MDLKTDLITWIVVSRFGDRVHHFNPSEAGIVLFVLQSTQE